jgi:hypothetical protein
MQFLGRGREAAFAIDGFQHGQGIQGQANIHSVDLNNLARILRYQRRNYKNILYIIFN